MKSGGNSQTAVAFLVINRYLLRNADVRSVEDYLGTYWRRSRRPVTERKAGADINEGRHSDAARGNAGRALKIIIVVAVVVVLFAAARWFDLQEIMRDALSWISSLGPLGPMIFAGLYILACVLSLPGSILTLGAGALFGVITGSVAVSIGSTLGATCAFLIGRYLARDWVAGRIAGNDKFGAVDEAVGREGWKIVLLTRLSPVFPFNLLNYAFGLTTVSFKHYFIASWLGMIPGTVMYVYIGSLAGDLSGLGSAGHRRTGGEWLLYGVGLLATLAVTVYVTRLARRALAARMSSENSVGGAAKKLAVMRSGKRGGTEASVSSVTKEGI